MASVSVSPVAMFRNGNKQPPGLVSRTMSTTAVSLTTARAPAQGWPGISSLKGLSGWRFNRSQMADGSLRADVRRGSWVSTSGRTPVMRRGRGRVLFTRRNWSRWVADPHEGHDGNRQGGVLGAGQCDGALLTVDNPSGGRSPSASGWTQPRDRQPIVAPGAARSLERDAPVEGQDDGVWEEHGPRIQVVLDVLDVASHFVALVADEVALIIS